ncbi:MAG: phosphatase PAP2 family protein [Rhodocyclaceae bacterium]|nr:phosphatase PAP2 family protein [Rhodocyclaceae bacterium]
MNGAPRISALLAALALASGVFLLAPGIDLAASAWFYREGRWLLEAVPGMSAFNKGFNTATHWFSGVLAATVLGLVIRQRLVPAVPPTNLRRTGYLLLVIALGPGLLVNAGLKEHWGRARPAQIAEFGGSAAYTPVWLPTDGCASNCSFVSGHVAFATVPVAGAWMATRRRARRAWLVGGLATGALMGFCRVGLGRHFLSDALIATVLVTLVAAVVAALMSRLGAPPDGASGTMQVD